MKSIPLRGDPERPSLGGRKLLERAVAVVTFTPVAQIEAKEGSVLAAFQEEIRHAYPFFEEGVDSVLTMSIDEDGSINSRQDEKRKWLFRDIDRAWTVTLSQSSLSIDGSGEHYTTWDDFLERLDALVRALEITARPTHVDRVGLRYLNTAPAHGAEDPRKFCAPQLASISRQRGLHISDLLWVFDVEEGRLLLRNGLMPPKSSYDPNFFLPRQKGPTWYLDIDVISEGLKEFNINEIRKRLHRQALRLHAIYYWAVPNEK